MNGHIHSPHPRPKAMAVPHDEVPHAPCGPTNWSQLWAGMDTGAKGSHLKEVSQLADWGEALINKTLYTRQRLTRSFLGGVWAQAPWQLDDLTAEVERWHSTPVVEPWNRENHRKQGGLCFVLYGIPTLVKNKGLFHIFFIHSPIVGYIYSGLLLSHEKEWMRFAVTLMDIEIIIPNEVGQRKASIWYHICGIWKRSDTKELIYKTNRLTNLENKLLVTKVGKVGERDKLGLIYPN